MLSNKVIDYLNKQGVYSEKEDKAYKKALIDLGIDLNSDFALFNLNTTEITFRGQCGEIYNVCWFKIYSNDLSYGIERQAVLGIPSEYLPLDSFEGEGGFFYNRNTGEVLEIELGNMSEETDELRVHDAVIEQQKQKPHVASNRYD